MNASLNTWLRFRLPFASTLAAQESLLSRVTQTFISAGSVFGDVIFVVILTTILRQLQLWGKRVLRDPPVNPLDSKVFFHPFFSNKPAASSC